MVIYLHCLDIYSVFGENCKCSTALTFWSGPHNKTSFFKVLQLQKYDLAEVDGKLSNVDI